MSLLLIQPFSNGLRDLAIIRRQVPAADGIVDIAARRRARQCGNVRSFTYPATQSLIISCDEKE